MTYSNETMGQPELHHAVICRDTLDGRVSVEHQTRSGTRICHTELVATVAPAEAAFEVQECVRKLNLNIGSIASHTGQQIQTFPRFR